MTILFASGEFDDFARSGTTTTEINTVRFRAAYARIALGVSSGSPHAHYIRADFAATATPSATCRYYLNGYSVNNCLAWFGAGGTVRLRLLYGTGGVLVLQKLSGGTGTSGGTATTLATSTLTVGTVTVQRLDWLVDYQTAGRCRVYVDGVLFIDYSGDVTVSGTTTLNNFACDTAGNIFAAYYSEIIVADEDVRTLSLKTLVPDGAGTYSQWTGGYADIDEAAASETDVMISGTAGQVSSVTCTGMPAGWANMTVRAVRLMASAARGATGPQGLSLGVRTNSTDYFASAVALDTGFSTPAAALWDLNPVTGAAWTPAEIDALELAFRSET